MEASSIYGATTALNVIDLTKSTQCNIAANKEKLTWLLVKNDPPYAYKYGPYHIITTADVIAQELSDLFIKCVTNYYYRNLQMTGRIMAASENIIHVERLMKKWVHLDRKRLPSFHEYLLVQYRPTPYRVVHKVVHEHDVVPIMTTCDKEAEHMDVFVQEGEKMCQACVLTRNHSKEVLMDELAKVKMQISAVIGYTFMRPEDLEKDATTVPEGNPWILIQYATELADCFYTIMRYDDTLKLEENQFPGFQTFVHINGNIHQAFIMHKSHNCEEVLSALHNLVNSCVISVYPHFSDMSFRQAGLKRTMVSIDENGKPEYEEYVCCLESRVIQVKKD